MKQIKCLIILSVCLPFFAFSQDYKTSTGFENGYKSVYQTIPSNDKYEGPAQVYGLINSSGKLVLPIVYKSIYRTSEKTILRIKDSKNNEGLFSTVSEKIIVEPLYNDIRTFSDGLAVVLTKKSNGGFIYGAVDTKGNLVIPVDYDYLGQFKDGLINFKKDGKMGFLNIMNNIIIPAMYDIASNFSEGLAAVKTTEEGKFGFIDIKNKIVIAPKYEASGDFYKGYAKVTVVKGYSRGRARSGTVTKVESEYVLINKKGTELFDSTYHSISYRQEGGLFVVELDKKKGVLDSTGKQIVPIEFYEVEINKDGNISFKKTVTGKKGMMNRKGVEILKPQYDFLSNPINGRFYSKRNGNIAVWNSSGKLLVPEDNAAGILMGKTKIILYYKDEIKIFNGNGKLVKTIADHRFKNFGHKLSENEESITLNADQTAYLVNLTNNSKKYLPVTEVGNFNEEGIFIGKDTEYDFYDYNGKRLNTEGFHSVVNFSEGICALQKTDKSIPYLADKGFKKIKDLSVSFSGPFSEGLAYATNKFLGKVYYLDKSGKEVFSLVAKRGGECTAGYIVVQGNNSRYNHLTKKGAAVGSKTWEEASSFSEGLAPVKDKGKWGFIDTTGNIAIELKYDVISPFSKGTAVVKSGNDFFLINKKGEPLNSNKYEAANNPGNGSFPLKKNGKTGIVDNNGNTIVDFKYKNIMHLSENRTWATKDSTWGLVDSKGKELTAFVYDVAYEFVNGFAQVKLKDKIGLVNNSGKLVIPAVYKSMGKVYKNTVICLKGPEEITVSLK